MKYLRSILISVLIIISISTVFSCSNVTKSKLEKSQHFKLNLEEPWVTYRLDYELSNGYVDESAFGVPNQEGESFKNVSLKIRTLTDNSKVNWSELNYPWLKDFEHLKKDNRFSSNRFIILSATSEKEVLDESINKTRVYLEEHWFVEGKNKDFFISYGSYNKESFKHYYDQGLEIIQSLEEK